MAYASQPSSIRASDQEFSDETSRLLLDALRENTETVGTDVDMLLENNGTSWDITFDSDFTNAVMGNIQEALETFTSIQSDVQA